MRRLTTISVAFLLLFAVAALAQKYAPLPNEITAAKTVYIMNLTGEPLVKDKAYEELRRWKRFQIIEDTEKADLVFAFTRSVSADAGLIAVPITLGNTTMIAAAPTRGTFITLRVFDAKKPENTAIWTVTRSTVSDWGTPNVGTKNCIKELRQRMPKEK